MMTDWIFVLLISLVMICSALLGQEIKDQQGRSPERVGFIRQTIREVAGSSYGVSATRLRSAIDADKFLVLVLAALAGLRIQERNSDDSLTSDTPHEKGASDAISQRISLKALDLSESDLTYRNFVGRDLSGAILANADLSHADLRRANISGAFGVRARFRGTNLTRATMMSALFADADFTDADLSWSNLSGAILTGARLNSATLIGVTWTKQTAWPVDIADDIRRRSVQIGFETYQVVPTESNDRVLS
jgi:uncharacterized protein YjbI with pentapeptide repeats